MTTRYTPGGVTVSIGKSQEVQLPPRVLRGRCTCLHFDTDKAFLLPMSVPGICNLRRFYDRYPGLTVLVNGHTDVVGDPVYNRKLSNERAEAVVAYLMNRVDDWLAWYSAPNESKRWSTTEDQHMLHKLTDRDGTEYHPGPITGTNDPVTQDATRRFQADHQLVVDGKAGPVTRRKLIEQYMLLDGTSLPPSAILVTHGCGEAHPVDATTGADQDNRRVEVFLFDGPVDPPPQQPCPLSGCTQYPVWVAQTVEEVDLCQPETHDLDIIVVDDQPQPQPIPAARVSITAPGIAPIVVGDDGRGAFRDVPEGTYELTATHPDFETTTQPVSVPVAPATVSSPSVMKVGFAQSAGNPPPASTSPATVIRLEAAGVYCALSWTEDLISALPEGAEVTLSGGGKALTRVLEGAGDVRFDDLPEHERFTLTARAGGQEVVLFHDQLLADVQQGFGWDNVLGALIPEPPPGEAEEADTPDGDGVPPPHEDLPDEDWSGPDPTITSDVS